MNAQDEEDFVFACLLGAYIQSLRQQEERQQQFHAEKDGQSAACRKKADEKATISVGARMVRPIGRQKAATGPLLNISHQRAPQRRCLPEPSEDAP